MSMELTKCKLGEVVTLLNGRAYLMPELQDSGKYRILRVGNLSGGNDSWYYSDMELDDNKYCESGDLLYAWACNFGPHIWKEEKVIFHYHIWKLVVDKKKINKFFLYYYLLHQTPFYLGGVNGATMVHITKKNMEKKTIYIPCSLETQHDIASILSTYDTLIENNTKRIRLLEKMAENLYKEWFVRFRFPGYEKVEMENGLPKGWTVEKVKDWCRVFTGRKDVNQTKEDGQYVFFSCSPNTFHSDEFIYDGKAILVAGNGSYTGRTRYFEGKFDLYQRTYAVVSNKEDDSFMFYLYLRFKFDFEPMHSGGTRGSAIPYIVMKDLTKYKFLYKEDIVEEYIKKVKPMFAEIDNLQQQNILLARQRDLLLPRLMSGKLEV